MDILANFFGRFIKIDCRPAEVIQRERDMAAAKCDDTPPCLRLSRPGTPEAEFVDEDPPSQSKTVRFIDTLKKSVFIVGTALIVFAAARNSITWHLQNVWGASGDFWQAQWGKVLDLFHEDRYNLFVWGTFVWTTSIFWLFNLLLIFLDATGKPAALLKYKIQADKNVPVDKKALASAVLRVAFNQTAVGIPMLVFMYFIMQIRGCDHGRELPTFQWVVFELLVFILVEEVGFYYSHRLVHHPRIYKHVHKIHHEWTAPIGIIALYAHPFEHLFSNLAPPGLGPVLMGSHLSTTWLWYALALVSTTISHSGYHFPFLPSPEAHDFHHLKFNQNYGVLGLLDRLHGTDNLFRASKQYERHIMFLGLTPIRQQIPDSPKRKKSE